MGNTLLQPVAGRQLNPIKSFEEFIMQNPELSNRQYLSENKVFRTVQFSIKNESKILMKVYLKRNMIQLSSYYNNFELIKKRLSFKSYPNLFPYLKFINFERTDEDFVAVTRQFVNTTLQDRFQAIPKLSLTEQLWIITQTIIGMYNLHNEKLFHGNLKTSNILLTTWSHVFISDFATYKSFYINDISQFKLFYFTSEDNCSLAPEKFVNDLTEIKDLNDNYLISELSIEQIKIFQKMDMFSLGCLIAEIILNGSILFNYEQLQSYIKNQYDPIEIIKKIPDINIQKIVLNLIDKNPSKRMKIDEVLSIWFQSVVSNKVFDVLYYIDGAMVNQNFSLPDVRIGLIKKLYPLIYEEYISFNESEIPILAENLPISIQEIKILYNFSKVVQEMKPNLFDLLKKQKPGLLIVTSGSKDEKFKAIENMDNLLEKDISHVLNNFKLRKNILNDPENNKNIKSEENKIIKRNLGNESLNIIINILCSNLRNVKYSGSKLVALEILKIFSDYTTDYIKFHIICPFISSLFEVNELKDELIISRSFSIFCYILSNIKEPFQTISDCKLYSSFVWENITKVVEYENIDIIQSTFSKNIHIITEVCSNFLFQTFTKKNINFTRESSEYLKELEELKKKMVIYIHNILSHKNFEIQEILLGNLYKLCASKLFDEKTSSSEIFPLIISCLNKKKQVCLSILPNISRYFSSVDVNLMLITCIEACLNDSDEIVVLETVKCFKELVKFRLLENKIEQYVLEKIVPLVLYPNLWIRDEVLNFLGEILEKYNPTEIYCYIQPKLNKYLKEKIMLNKDILEYVMPEMLDKESLKNLKEIYNQAQNKDNIDLVKNEKKPINYKFLFYEEYYKSCHTNNQVPQENEDLKDFNNLFNEINKSDFKGIKALGNRINVFLTLLFFENIPENIYSLLDKYDITELKEKKELRFEEVNNILRNFLQEKHRVDISISDLSSFKYKLLNYLELELATMSNYYLEKKNLQNTSTFKLLQATQLEINDILFKMKQFEILNEIDLGYIRNELNQKLKYPQKDWKPSNILVTTIYEHSDVVSCLESLKETRYFVSGSYDGNVRVFDVDKLESDFTSDSIASFKCEENHKIKALKFIENTSSILVGTDKGIIDLYNIDWFSGSNQISKDQLKSNFKSYLGRYQVNGEVKKIENFKQENEKCFIYITHKGELGIEDLRSKNPALKLNCGMERGSISSMKISNNAKTAYISTLNGYLLLYDIRCNLIYNIFQLCHHDKKPIPIINMSNYYKYNAQSSESELLAISLGSNHHEIGVFDIINSSTSYLNPTCFFVSTTEENPIFKIPYLAKKDEIFSNYNYKYSERSVYEHFSFNSSYKDVISFLDDPLMNNQNRTKEEWLKDSLNSLQKMTNYFNYKNIAKKMICLPFNSFSNFSNNKNFDNIMITCGNDRNIRFWRVQNEIKIQKDIKNIGHHINNADGKETLFKQERNGDIEITHEYQKPINNFQYNSENENFKENNDNLFKYDEKVCHKDVIEDMVFIDRDKGSLIVTASRDHTIKLWK